eukprot:3941871-Rhodomonas_salina.3
MEASEHLCPLQRIVSVFPHPHTLHCNRHPHQQHPRQSKLKRNAFVHGAESVSGHLWQVAQRPPHFSLAAPAGCGDEGEIHLRDHRSQSWFRYAHIDAVLDEPCDAEAGGRDSALKEGREESVGSHHFFGSVPGGKSSLGLHPHRRAQLLRISKAALTLQQPLVDLERNRLSSSGKGAECSSQCRS